MRRVAYIWSCELQDAADALPANRGRSRMVHALVAALGLVDLEGEGGEEGATQGEGGKEGEVQGDGHIEYEEDTGSDDRGEQGTRDNDCRQQESGDEDPVSAGSSVDVVEGSSATLDSGPPVAKGSNSNSNDSGGAQADHASRNEAAKSTCPPSGSSNSRAGAANGEPGLETGGRPTNGCSTACANDAAPHSSPIPDTTPGSSRATVVHPAPELATAAELRKYHDARYVDYLLGDQHGDDDDGSDDGDDDDDDDDDYATPQRKRRRVAGLEYDCPPFPELGAYARLVAASTLTACRMLARGEADIAIAWDGGRHHAARSRASGFCYVADVVLGILMLAGEAVPRPREPGGQRVSGGYGQAGASSAAAEHSANSPAVTSLPAESVPRQVPAPAPRRRARILYLDMDLHYGDGVAQAFASPSHFSYPLGSRVPRPPQVLTLSVHHTSRVFFPPGAPALTPSDTPHPFSLSLPLAAYAHSCSYARLWRCVERIRTAWDPDFVVLQLGVDGLPADPVGMYGAWGLRGEGSLPWVVKQVRGWGLPTAVLGGGGYVHPNAARAWALTTGVLTGNELDPDSDVPDHEGMEAYAPSFTLDVPESEETEWGMGLTIIGNVPDETTDAELDEADKTYAVLADRIAEIMSRQK